MLELKIGSVVFSKNQNSEKGIRGTVVKIFCSSCSVLWENEKSSIENPEELIYIGTPNQYGFRYNLYNPIVSKYYQRFKEKRGLHRCFPLTDKQRFEFERGMDQLILNGRYLPEEILEK